jgi:arginine:ornithine antiporter / lysine permease
MESTDRQTPQKVSVPTLVGIVIGSMVGGGVFTLPRSFGSATGVLGAIIAWIIAGTGMLMLAFVFQSLAVRRPDLDSGVYIYAKTGFGNFAGFSAAFGYWASNVAGNVFFLVFTMTTLGSFFPGLGEGNTLLAVALASACVWFFHYLIARGVRQAAAVNWIVTVAKLVPIVVFIIIVGLAFDPQTFSANFWGGEPRSAKSLFDQVRDTMLVTTFVFLGVEGASVYSRLARRREDVGRATLLGFLSVLAIFASVTMVSYGVLPRQDLANTRPPSMAAVLESVVGPWGATFVSIGVIISVQGAYLAWTLINAEVLYMPATTAVMPRYLARNNTNHTPIAALITTNLAVQALLLTVLFVRDALDFMLALDTALSLIPYLFASGYALKLTITRETYTAANESERRRQQIIAAAAVLYAIFLLYAAGLKYLLVASIVYAAGILLYVWARREQRMRVFRPAEAVTCVVLVVAAVVGIVLISTGYLTL